MLSKILYKIGPLLLVVLCYGFAFAENDTSAVTEEVVGLKTDVTFEETVPSQYVYSLWDTTKVDPYQINVKDSLEPTFLELVSRDCPYTMPIPGEVTSKFGWRHGRMHKGIDLDLITGDTVACVFDGMVRISEYSRSFGYFIVVRHYNGLETLYAHLSKLKVSVGDIVSSGQLIGLGGNTGRSRGSHLHFEVRFLGKAINPETLFDFNMGVLKVENYIVSKKDFKHVYSASKYKGGRYHTIRSGDTLGHIARKYHTSVGAICRMNGMRSTTILRIGRRLRVR